MVFAKMADKTISVSGFLFRFELHVVDFVESDIHLYIGYVGEFSRYRGLKSHFWPWFFAKMATKTTSVSGFHFRFEFSVLDFIRNGKQVDT